MTSFRNDLVDIQSWPTLDEDDLIQVLPSYAKARGIVWVSVTMGTGLVVWGPLWALSVWGQQPVAWGWWLGLGCAWVVSMGIWGLEEWKGWPIRAYLVRENDVVYQHGWWSRTVVAVPFDRIQHSEIQQGPLGRWLGHCTLKLYTAGSSGAHLEIPGLHMATARNIRRCLENIEHA